MLWANGAQQRSPPVGSGRRDQLLVQRDWDGRCGAQGSHFLPATGGKRLLHEQRINRCQLLQTLQRLVHAAPRTVGIQTELDNRGRMLATKRDQHPHLLIERQTADLQLDHFTAQRDFLFDLRSHACRAVHPDQSMGREDRLAAAEWRVKQLLSAAVVQIA